MDNKNINLGYDPHIDQTPVVPRYVSTIDGHGGQFIHADGDLSECARLHEEEVMTNDSYELRKLHDRDKGIQYVVDVGANVGAFSYFIKELWPEAHVISCEPEPKCMEWVKKNTRMFKDVTYVNKAIVGDSNLKEVTFNVCKWAGNGHVEGTFDMNFWKRYGCQVEEKITVPAVTLMKVIEDNKFPRIDLLKVDTEGSESVILQGIKPWLKNVKYITGEYHSQVEKALITDILKDTHNIRFTDGIHFKEDSGLSANGDIFAELK